MPFLMFALAGPVDSGFRVRAVLLASLSPAAALAGLTQRARRRVSELPIGPWQGAGVLALWAVAALLGGGLLLRARDV
ncbi:hypothetical protein [Streptomyces sp. NBC_01794]|uniref:hypothetical protein n=1 Tax=Streptomyces sp. NBC_01794 TaxID=2975942 RepID=UPI00308519AA|nr:hypothetical protein OIE54_37650 [Streptomyces sp. NBC_01794]